MAKQADVVTALETFLEGLSWTSDDGKGTTKFNEVYTYRNYEHGEGSPFAVITTPSADGDFETNRTYRLDNTINVDICVNWAQIESATTDDGKRAEAMLRLREVWDYVKTQLYLINTWHTTLGMDIGYNPGYSEIDEENIFGYRINLTLTELLNA